MPAAQDTSLKADLNLQSWSLPGLDAFCCSDLVRNGALELSLRFVA